MDKSDVVQCVVGDNCLNGFTRSHNLSPPKCAFCWLAPNSDMKPGSKHYWRPLDRIMKHPTLAAYKRDKARGRVRERARERASKDKKRIEVLRKSKAAEKKTEKSIIHATKNSGRVNKDGDHIAVGNILIDTKQQSREHPVVVLDELDKAARDASRSGKLLSCLVIRNIYGRGVVVMTEASFGILLEQLKC